MKRKKLSIFILSAAIVTSSVSYGMTAKADEVKETKGYNYNVNLSEQKAVANNKISVKKVNGEILGYANPFTMLQILNMNGKTVEVITQSGLRGYVDANEFTLVESAVNDKLIEKNIEGHVTNVSTVLNLRKEPRIGAEIINRLLNNTKVNILGKQGSWYKIELNGQKGYVYGMFLNEGTMKENSSKTIANKKSEVKSEYKKEKKSSVKKEAKKEVVSGAKAKVAQKQREEAKANMTSEVKPAINKETKSNNKVEVKSEVKKEAKNEVKTEMNSVTKAETNQVVTSEIVQAVKSEKNPETNLQVRPEIKSEEKTEMISKENLNVNPEAKKEGISEEIKPEVNTEVESKPEMNKEVKVEEAKVEEKQEPKQEEVQDSKAKEMDELLKSEEYKFLRMSISYGERLVDRNDVYTKDSLKILRTELAKAKKVFQDKDNLTMKLVQDTRDDLERAIVDLVKLSDVKKPVKSKAKVEVKKESNTEKKEEVKPVEASEEKVEVKEEPVKVEEKVEAKKEEVQDPKAKEMDELLKSEEYKFLRMSISYGERLVDRNDVYTKDSLKILRTELAKAKKVFQDKDNLTMKLVQDTRDDLERAIVDLVKLSDVKKPVKSKAKVEAKKESNTEKKEEVKEQPAKVEVIVPEVKENKEIKKEEPVKAKEVVKEKKSREEEIEEILKSEEYRFLLKDIAYGERLSEKITVYTRDSLKVLNAAIEKAGRIVRQKEKLTVKLVQDTRDDVDRAIVDLVKKNN
ncbi:SH3 domain-containing protein [Clostridium perfringens]|uniref:Enterotoxin EntC n=1 Tax=Clostridium perfringens (strain ATCC 13124 / DSM 756 / JCM 1290 / NCIMB 6125 / NCTC 8237 / Type A) TaxID=195103 RepID=A0A0H2YUR9_CLOP1|nr:SH3 domain-containing protein [Clostridium perfringens]ABG84864.1 putative enterotoxin EntC [Clostridium perfringens ATCC 13124]ELC8344917.1 SH3 domain-containing protein [Clostridium perfringens]MDK0589024.1 SH3 domain-containing protein [Clostridium perfringens]MDK0724221.1 SH3 domain-containing protein [Clostridium perfringens]MDM0641716.1 SH3 domain-containing protein [Clostridium perfringens]